MVPLNDIFSLKLLRVTGLLPSSGKLGPGKRKPRKYLHTSPKLGAGHYVGL